MRLRNLIILAAAAALVCVGALLLVMGILDQGKEESRQPGAHQESTMQMPGGSEAHDQRAKGADQYVARALPPDEQQGFDSSCKSAWLEKSDRIVTPGKPPPVEGMHLHQGFGTDVNYNSLLAEMHQSTSNCNRPEDTAGYWTPALLKPDGTVVKVENFKAYYRTDVPASQLHFPPENLKLIAGDRLATSPQSKQITSWNCKGTEKNDVDGPFTEPTNCSSADAKPRAKVTFPQCLKVRKTQDGSTVPLVDSEDHKSHAAYPTKTDSGTYRCPDTHPYAVVRVGYQISYYPRSDPRGADMSKVTLASGGRYSMHADFWQSFRMTGDNSIRALTERCFEAPGTFCKLGNEPQ